MCNDLAEFRLFRDLSPADLKLIEPFFSSGEFPTGEKLFSQGDSADTLYLVIKGELTLKYKPYDGSEITVTRLRDGDVLGWSTVLGNSNYTSSAVCKTDVSVLKVSGDDLRQLVADHPQTGKMVMDRLATAVSPRWKDAQKQVSTMLRKGMELPNQFNGGNKMDTTLSDNKTREAQLKALLDQLSAYIETYHGGSVEYVDLEKDTLKVHLGGACLGCPLSPATLHGWVAGTVRQFFPEITQVEAV